MAVPTVAGTPTTAQNASGTTLTLTKPSGLVNKDVLVAVLRSQSATTTGDYLSSGFTRASADFVASQGTARAMGIYYKVVSNASTEPASYDFTRTDTGTPTARQAGAMFILRGVDNTNPVAGHSTNYIGTSITNGKQIDSFTVAAESLLVSIFASEFTANISEVPTTPPSGHTLIATGVTAGAVTTTRTGVLAYGKGVTAGENVSAVWSASMTAIGAQGVAFRGATGSSITYVVKQNTSIGHRGASLNAPEMSFGAYSLATARGLPALEFSVGRTSDNVMFGLHDESLDRTSLGVDGTTLIASNMTWAQVQQYKILPPSGVSAPSQDYITAKQMFDTYAKDYIIFVDPKLIPSSGFAALLDLMDSYPDSKNHFIAKGYCDSTTWATAARARGYQAWGYFYTADVTGGKIATRAGSWDYLGLEWSASQANWDLIRNVDDGAGGKKPVIGHIIDSTSAQTMAYSKGAYATMVSAVSQNFALTNKQMWGQVFAGTESVTAVYSGDTKIWP